jgi:tRNA (guanine37-N1)-methyltransferase
MRFDIVTIFPEFFRGPLDYGIVRRARETGLIEVAIHDLRAFTHDRHRTVDDRPFGGGEGMVLKPEPLFELLDSLTVAPREERRAGRVPESVVLLSAQGELFTQQLGLQLALGGLRPEDAPQAASGNQAGNCGSSPPAATCRLDRLVLICGRYEGVDERVSEFLADREISVGDYVLSGGELPAAILVDVVTRLLPGALGNQASAWQESFQRPAGGSQPEAAAPAEGRAPGAGAPDSTCPSGGLLDYPQYTRPAEYRGMKVPEVLLGGNHDQIRRWRRRQALQRTLLRRPELLRKGLLSGEDREVLEEEQQATNRKLQA